MNENAQKLNAIVAALLIFASVLGVAVIGRGKSGTQRPALTGSDPRSIVGSQTVPNRLWQDPFEALVKLPSSTGVTNAAAGSEPGSLNTTSALSAVCQAQTNSETTVLAVFLEGAPYPEDKETRRRIRYAIELALLSSDFAPNDRKHIGVDSVPVADAGATREQKLAFEWFSRTSGSGNALVLWLPEEDFAEKPLSRLDRLWDALALPVGKAELIIIGPRSSDTLRAMAIEWNSPLPLLNVQEFRILSPHATAPDSALFPGARDTPSREHLQNEFLSYAHWADFQPWIATDQQLSVRVTEELKLRGIPGDNRERDVIVLISEADTFYGRSLPRTLETELTAPNGFLPSNIWLFSYLRGLEGIKPAKTAKDEEQQKLPATPEAMLQAALTKKGETAEGESQQDYARRFADFLKSQENRYARNGPRIRAIGLTGSDFYDKLVLLQALRSHFPEAVFFTTDLDAGYWAKPDQLAYTRNLLVASSYSLDPELIGLGPHFMPFRDVYQSATFAACRAALRPVNSSAPMEALLGDVYEIGRHGPVKLVRKTLSATAQAEDRSLAQVLAIFAERVAQLPLGVYVALMGAAALVGAFFTLILRHPPVLEQRTVKTPEARQSGATLERERELVCAAATGSSGQSSPAASRPPQRRGRARPFSFQDADKQESAAAEASEDKRALKAGAAELVRPVYPRLEWRAACRFCAPAVIAVGVAMVFLLGGAACQYIANLGSEEPWLFTHGVSIWPTEAIRVLAIFLAARFFISAWRGEKKNREALWNTFFSPDSGEPGHSSGENDSKSGHQRPGTLGRILNWSQTVYRQIALGGWHEQVQSLYTNGRLDATQLFKGYAELCLPWKRGLRLFVNVALLMFGLSLVFALLGDMPTRSCVRGELSRRIDIIVLALAVLGFFVVLFYAIDATRLAARMLTYIEKPTAWPKWRKDEVANRWCLCRDDTDPLIDMQFAVEHTQHVRSFMLSPFVLLLLLLVSRLNYFEAWTWPVPLACVFVLNFVLAATCWAVLRRSAYRVRTAAIKQLTGRAIQCEHAALLRHRKTQGLEGTALWIQSGTGDYEPEKYAERLRQVADGIKNERGGAFAPWIQDPTYLFLFIPTGITGILTVALHFLMN